MKIRSINAEKMGLSNRLTLLNLIRTTPGISRRELARSAGLDPSTVTKIISALLEKGLVEESGLRTAVSPGRKSVMLTVAREGAAALVAELGVESTRIAVGYLDASLEVKAEFSTPRDQGEFFTLFASRLDSITGALPRRTFCALSIAVPGMVEWGSNILKDLPHMGWKNVNFEETLKRHLPGFDLPVFAANEAKLSLIAEMFLNPGIADHHNGIYVYLSQGVGGAILVEDKILHGLNNTAGEIGHMVIDTGGPACHCGSRGCFETFVSIDRVAKKYEEEGAFLPGDNFREKFRHLLSLGRKGDPRAADVLGDMKGYLAIGLANLTNILNPEFIMLGGVGSTFPPDFLEDVRAGVFRRALGSASPRMLLTQASLGIDSAALEGAAFMAMNHYIKKVI